MNVAKILNSTDGKRVVGSTTRWKFQYLREEMVSRVIGHGNHETSGNSTGLCAIVNIIEGP
jgi:hypothetical protein